MAAAESWGPYPQEVETLAEQMDKWSAEMAAMSDGAPGYASLKRYEAYVASLRATDASELPTNTVSNGQDTLPGGGNIIPTGAGLVQSVASRLGLIRNR